ncbi:MAG TPA: YeeE/YedE family protein [Steroidobacteraceae bacterium]
MNLLHPLLGGVLIGAGAALLLWRNGQVAGISGITASVIRGEPGDTGWRLAFLAGLLAPAAIVGLDPSLPGDNLAVLVLSGLLVGIGTRIGSGCTSGHGVCGISSLSPRSIVATLIFMATAMLTVAVVRHGMQP